MLVEEAVQADVDLLPVELRGSGLAAACLELARQLDSAENSAAAKAACARVLVDSMAQLLALRPAVKEADKVDQLASRRAARRAKSKS